MRDAVGYTKANRGTRENCLEPCLSLAVIVTRLCCAYCRLFFRLLFVDDFVDKTCFEEVDDGKINEHPGNEKEFSVKFMKCRG